MRWQNLSENTHLLLRKNKASEKLKPFVRPKYAFYLGLILLALSQEKDALGGLLFGLLLNIMGTPLSDTYMQQAYPNTGETEARAILKAMMLFYLRILVLTAIIFFVLNFFGKKLFGTLSANLTYDIRKILYSKILSKNIGFFDFPENSSSVLSTIM